MERYKHQIIGSNFMAAHPRCYNTSDPGTCKTITSLDAYLQNPVGRLLVLAPLSILQPSWGDDILKATNLSYAIAHGSPKKRLEAFKSGAKVVIANHDAVNWLVENLGLLEGFSHCVIDEFKVFKNHTRARSKAAKKITDRIPFVWMLSGTPNSETLTDIWYPTFLLDHGQRLGKKYWDFRSQVCYPKQNGPRPEHVKWVDKPEAIDLVAAKLQDITIRFKLEDCIDMPERIFRTLELDMPNWLEQKYRMLEDDAVLESNSGFVSAINAAAKSKKLLQLLSGAVYDASGEVVNVHTERYELVMDLVEEREQTLVAYNWKHELEALEYYATTRGIPYAIINGDVSRTKREEAVRAFQAGEIRVIFAHPQAAGHGLTLTKGKTIIWASPTYVGEWFIQFNARIYRAGQTERTEVIQIAYKNSKEIEVYQALGDKLTNLNILLKLFEDLTKVQYNVHTNYDTSEPIGCQP